jgi:aspartate carbamoyltransferase catalytic subunit
VTIVGDILHSRVARSNLHALAKLGAVVRVAGPRSLLPQGIEELGALVYDRIEPALEGADVVMVLRLQHERMTGGYVPSLRDYSRFFGVNAKNVRAAKADAIVMHPGPINRGVELTSDVADGPRSVILDQVAYGVSIRMAVLESVASA